MRNAGTALAAIVLLGLTLSCSRKVEWASDSLTGPIKGLSYPVALDLWRLESVAGVIDLNVSREGQTLRVHLPDIEATTDSGVLDEANEFLKQEWLGKIIAIDNRTPEIIRHESDSSQKAFVYLIVADGAEARVLSVELVRLGFASTKFPGGYKYHSRLVAAQEQARENKRGMWK